MKLNKGAIIAIISIFSIVFLIVVWIFSVEHRAIVYEQKVEDAWSSIEIQKKRQADLYRTLADAIKSHNKHEAETYLNTVNARAGQNGVISDADIKEINQLIDVTVERYPTLESEKNYKTFMSEASSTENLIAEARKAYNTAVTRYNSYVKDRWHKTAINFLDYEVIEFEKISFDNASEDAPTNLFDD